jgi:putative peptidoglycan lipid II flippase
MMMTSKATLRHQLVKTAGITAAMSAAGALTGLALDGAILFSFGAGLETDALLVAMTVPTLLNGIVNIQGPKVLIPVFAALFERNEEHEAWLLLRNLLTACCVLFGAVACAGAMLSGVLVPLQIPGLHSNAIALAVSLSRILFVLVWCQSLASILQAVLYARHSYLVSSAGKLVINSVAIIVVLIATRSQLGIGTVAWGMVLGNLVQLGLLAIVLGAHGFQYRWRLEVSDPRLRAIFAAFGYPLAGHVLGESDVIVQNALGSFLGSGSVTLLRYAARIVQAIGGILLGSVVQVTLPVMARHAAANDLALQRKALLESFQILGLVGLPLSIWLIFMAEPLVLLFFQRGQFSPADAAMTALIIIVMVPQFFLTRFVNVSQQLFYANSDLRTPFVSTVIYTIANICCAVVLAQWFGEAGIGASVSIASTCNVVYMMLKLQSSFGPIGWSRLRTFALRLGTTSLLAAGGFAAGLRALSMASGSEWLLRVLAVAMPTAIGVAVFVSGVFALRLFDTGLIATDRQQLVP